MLAFILIGIVLGAVAWQLKHGPGDPKPSTQMLFGVVGAVVGGVGYNLTQDVRLMDMDAGGIVSAALLCVIVLAVLQTRVGRD